MSDLLGLKTKKVTTYGRRGNRSNIIPIHNDLSPVRNHVIDLSSPSPTTPYKRPPLTSKVSQGFNNIPQSISPPPMKDRLPVRARTIIRVSTPSDSPRLVRRMHRPGRAVLPPSPSIYTVSPSPFKSTSARIHCVEIPPSVPRPRRAGLSKLGQYRELSESITEGLDRLVLAEPAPTPTRARSPSSSPIWVPSPLPAIAPLPDLERVCSSPSTRTFQDILAIASSLSSSTSAGSPTIVKAGEATYSEVFSIKAESGADIVMKIIPITRSAQDEQGSGELPYRSPADDVAKEVEITKRMSGLEGGGFVTFFGAYVVQGKYHPDLLAEWDRYADSNGTENIRPSCFGQKQEYVVIFLHDGGDDLEAFQFAKKTGWVQAAGVFWQVADALARAEEWTEFEHRDLHEGQILIDYCSADSDSLDPLDPASSGVRATIIDFGLSRLRADDSSRIVSTAIPDEVLEGEGEQWDVYRAITKRVKGDWEGYHPVTNLLWLQYILNLILLHTPTLRRPKPTPSAAASRIRTTARVISSTRGRTRGANVDQERSETAYRHLLLAKEAVDNALSGRTRRGGGGKMECAADLVAWARSKEILS